MVARYHIDLLDQLTNWLWTFSFVQFIFLWDFGLFFFPDFPSGPQIKTSSLGFQLQSIAKVKRISFIQQHLTDSKNWLMSALPNFRDYSFSWDFISGAGQWVDSKTSGVTCLVISQDPDALLFPYQIFSSSLSRPSFIKFFLNMS